MVEDCDGYEKMGTWGRKILGWIYGPVVEEGIWRLRIEEAV